MLATIVSVAAGAYQSAVDLTKVVTGGADDELRATIAKEGRDKSLFIAQLERSGSDIQSLGEAYSKIEKSIEKADNRDSAKILVKQEDFEKTLQPYIDLQIPEAIALRDQLRAYVDTTQTRNRKILELDSLRIKDALLRSELDQRKAELDRLSLLWEEIQDPGLAEYAGFMKRLYTQLKQDLVRTMYEEWRAWEYWALRELPFQMPSEQEVAVIDRFREVLTEATVRVKNEGLVNPRLLPGVVVTISENRMSTAFPEFRKTGGLTFSTENEPELVKLHREFAGLRVKRVKVLLPDAKGTNGNQQMIMGLTHSGRSFFLNSHRQQMRFSHVPLNIPISYRLDGERERTDGELDQITRELALPSPFTLWTLNVDLDVGIDLSHVKEIKVEMDLNYVSFTN